MPSANQQNLQLNEGRTKFDLWQLRRFSPVKQLMDVIAIIKVSVKSPAYTLNTRICIFYARLLTLTFSLRGLQQSIQYTNSKYDNTFGR